MLVICYVQRRIAWSVTGHDPGSSYITEKSRSPQMQSSRYPGSSYDSLIMYDSMRRRLAIIYSSHAYFTR